MATLNTPELASPAAVVAWHGNLAARLRALASSETLHVLALTGLAAAVRFIDLTGIPAGLHGDEAVAGLEAQRILREGSIGLYSRLAAGQPTGPLYLDALTVKLFGNTALGVRLVPALLGTLTIPLLYVVVRRSGGRALAGVAALLFAIMQWHIHFARIGFPLEAWPLVTVSATGALLEALQSRRWYWWLAAGALTGAGIYVYNGQAVFMLAVGVFVIGWLVWDAEHSVASDAALAGVLFAGLTLAALPMAVWAAYPSHHYFDHIHRDTITATAGWQSLDSPLSQLRFLAGRYFDVWARLTFRPEVDNVDATGVTAVVPLTMVLCAVGGIAVSLWRKRTALLLFGITVLVVAPLAPVFTVDGVTRRTFVMAPFVAIFAAMGVVELARLVRERWPGTPRFGPVLAAMFVAAMAWQNLYGYFGEFAGSPAERWVFVDDYIAAVSYIHGLPSGDFVYFYSERLSFNYEPRRYLAPDARGMDRSSQFGDGSIATQPRSGHPVFVLLGNYRSLLPAIRERYPGGATVTGPGTEPSFIAYVLP